MFAVRKGNPKNIKTWDDLVKPGVEVITPNPFTSGGARWNVMAAYGAQLEEGKTPAAGARTTSTQLFKNVSVQDKSAREALQTFTGGKGDVLIAYENEAITAQQKGQDVDYVIPDQTILIQNPIAVTSDGKNPTKAQGVRRLPAHAGRRRRSSPRRATARSIAVARSTRRSSRPRRACSRSTSSAAGRKVNDEFFDPDKGVVAKIEQDLGVSTAK